MRIAFDCRWFKTSNIDTLGGYMLNLVKALLEIDHENEYLLIFDREDRLRYFLNLLTEEGNKSFSNYSTKLIFPTDAVVRNFIFLPFVLRKERIDLFHSPYFFVQSMWKSYKIVLTLHDLLVYRFPQYFKLACPKLRIVFGLKALQQKLLKQADALIVHNHTFKEELLQTFGGIKAESIRIIAPGVRREFKSSLAQDQLSAYLKKYDLKPGYILFNGKPVPHMNLASLIGAYSMLPEALQEKHPLAITGTISGPYHKKLVKLVKKIKPKGKVLFTSFVSQKDLPFIYQGASLFVYPASYDPYGMPLIQALASGLPVICSETPYFKEITRGAALFFTPENTQNLSLQIKNLLQDNNFRLLFSEKSKNAGQEFDWKKAASETLQIYRQLSQNKF